MTNNATTALLALIQIFGPVNDTNESHSWACLRLVTMLQTDNSLLGKVCFPHKVATKQPLKRHRGGEAHHKPKVTSADPEQLSSCSVLKPANSKSSEQPWRSPAPTVRACPCSWELHLSKHSLRARFTAQRMEVQQAGLETN